LQRIAQHLQNATRLLTLTGPPGVGKTRLAIAAAQQLASVFRDGVVFVSLAAVRDPALVFSAIGRALDIHEQADESSFDQLVLALHDRQQLLVLDNLEQVADGAPMLVALLAACPGISVLATSRERLHVRGEQQLRLAPLPLPHPRDHSNPAQIAQSEAVQLFVHVAQAADHTFRLTPENATLVAALCTQLDGLPLALELVAARCDILPLPTLRAQLDQYVLVNEGPRDLPERQRTLRAALDWSYVLLSPAEQHLLNTLGVFVGGFSPAAVAQVGGGDGNERAALDLLSALASKSLVQHTATAHSEVPFSLLETIRLYALEQLKHRGQIGSTRDRHAHYYAELVAQAAPHLKDEAQQLWAERLRWAHDNLQAAFDWLLETGQIEQAGQICHGLRRFWWMSGAFRAGREWTARVLARHEHLSRLTHAQVLIADGMLASPQNKLAEGIAAFEAALTLARVEEEQETIAIATHNLGTLLVTQGEYARARALLEAGLNHDRRNGDQWSLAVSLGSLGELCYDQGDYAAADVYYRDSLAIYRQFADHNSIALTLNNLGEIARRLNDFAQAEHFLQEGLTLAHAHDLRRMLPFLLGNMSVIMLHQAQNGQARALLRQAFDVIGETGGVQALDTCVFAAVLLSLHEQRAELAAKLLGALVALRQHHGGRVPRGEQAETEGAIERVRATLPIDMFGAAWTAGQHLSMREALQAAQSV
jgi:predicted ATPase